MSHFLVENCDEPGELEASPTPSTWSYTARAKT
jgi:hypothetical protein